MALNLLNALCAPLSPESLRLVGFALRAIAHTSVDAVVLVTTLAVRLLRVDVAHGIRVALGVVADRHRVQVLRVDARAVSTCVIDDVSVWNRAAGQEERHAMRSTSRASEGDDPVAILVQKPCPQQTVSARNALVSESLHFRLRWFRMSFSVGDCGAHGDLV